MKVEVKVTQADREAAARLIESRKELYSDNAYLADVRNGQCGGDFADAFAHHRIEATRTLEAQIAEFLAFDNGSDASLNLQGALDDIRGRHRVDDGGVVERTLQRVINQIEQVRAALQHKER